MSTITNKKFRHQKLIWQYTDRTTIEGCKIAIRLKFGSILRFAMQFGFGYRKVLDQLNGRRRIDKIENRIEKELHLKENETIGIWPKIDNANRNKKN